ncbi:hypothetical protein [Sphingomonas sp.]|uniref:hypothetical protein n=1 Tax=Sphingomonas sp. TaxID=28214 RepID=UPI001B076F6C|nr:hypothetical protein [Sphingomonas sp.]MBO9714018.1 hypothetical protein [Sphingomonas sp.]
MLRNVVAALSILWLAGTVVWAAEDPAAWPMVCMAALFTAGIWLERFYYRGSASGRGGGAWSETGERFVDTESGRMVTVWYNGATGERRYVEAGETPPAKT